jgi:hypothetical protein
LSQEKNNISYGRDDLHLQTQILAFKPVQQGMAMAVQGATLIRTKDKQLHSRNEKTIN